MQRGLAFITNLALAMRTLFALTVKITAFHSFDLTSYRKPAFLMLAAVHN
jgi:hypothetical protein